MANKNLLPSKTSLFRNKLSKILDRIQKDKGTLSPQTKEAYVIEAVKLVGTFYKTISSGSFKPNLAYTRTYPSYQEYNQNFQEIKDDVDILFAELENLESVVVEQFNLITAQTNRINSRIKRLNSQIADYSLYNNLPIKNAVFISDSFSDASKVEINSPLVNGTQCDLNQAEGIVTLPIDAGNSVVLDIATTPVVNSNSNGRSGNNEEVGTVALNDNSSVILDGNPDTWFEYERVVAEDDGLPLHLDITINLEAEELINFLRINPNNFGTKTEIIIEDIATSTDGSVFISIKDEIPVTGFLGEDEENVFKLAPSTNKFAGQGLYTFTPRFAKYVRIVLKQNSPYLIQTVQGTQYRYAIGLRDIEVKRIAFVANGELVSNVFNIDQEVKKVALYASQTSTSELAEVKHQLSFDDGNTWHDIQPLEEDAVLNQLTAAEEVLNINTEDENSIATAVAAKTIRHKTILTRNDSNFNESSVTFALNVSPNTEVKSVPLSEPWALPLDFKPIVDSIQIIDPNFGSRGNLDVKHIVGTGTGFKISFNLPWTDLYLDKAKNNNNEILKQMITSIYVGGEKWTMVPSFSGQSATAKVFTLAPRNQSVIEQIQSVSKAGGPQDSRRQPGTPKGIFELTFGDGVNGLSPKQGALIEVLFSEERLYPIGKESKTAELEFMTGMDKSNLSIYRKGLVLQNTIQLTENSNLHRLQHRNIIISSVYPMTFTNQDGTFTNEVSFFNGLAAPEGELNTSGDYSVDQNRGIIFSFDKTDQTPGTVTYYYQAQLELPSTEWEWADSFSTHKSIKIKDSSWAANKILEEPIDINVTKIKLSNFAIVEGSIKFNNIDDLDESVNPFLEEIPYIDSYRARINLSTTIKTTELIGTLTPIGDVASFTTSVNIHPNTSLGVAFTKADIFQTEVSTLVSVDAVGKYWVDRSTNTIHVHTNGSALTDTGEVTYYTEDSSQADRGVYAVDYKNGEIYLQRFVPTNDITINYEYSDYYARYNVALKEENENWSYDSINNRVIILPNEINMRSRLPSISGNNSLKPTTYQIDYNYIKETRKNIQELATFFSPILKDYTLQIVTADNL